MTRSATLTRQTPTTPLVIYDSNNAKLDVTSIFATNNKVELHCGFLAAEFTTYFAKLLTLIKDGLLFQECFRHVLH